MAYSGGYQGGRGGGGGYGRGGWGGGHEDQYGPQAGPQSPYHERGEGYGAMRDPYAGTSGGEFGQQGGYHEGYDMHSPPLDGGPGPDLHGYDGDYDNGLQRSLSDGDRRGSSAQRLDTRDYGQGRGYGQDQSYGHDHGHGHGHGHSHGHGRGRPHPNRGASHGQQQDRILREPMSPDNLPQDNAFPTFPAGKHNKKSSRDENRGDRQHHQNGYRAAPKDSSYEGAPQRHPSNDRPRGGQENSGWGDFSFDRDNRSQTMPTNNHGGHGPSFDLPHRPPRGHRRSDEGPNHPKRQFSEDAISPRSVNNNFGPPPRTDSFGAMERFDAGRGGSRGGNRPHPRHPMHNNNNYSDNYEAYSNSPSSGRHPFSSPEEEEMPNFDAVPANHPNEELHMGGQDGSRGRAPLRPPVHNFEPRSHSQPNFRDTPRGPGPQGGFGRSPTEMDRPGQSGYGGFGGSPPGPRGPGPQGAPPRSQPGAFEPGYGRGQYQQGPGRGPPQQFQPRPGPGPSLNYAGRGRQPPQGLPGSPAPGGAGPRGHPPSNRPTNPDALPEHPVPVRPGLLPGQGMNQSPVPQPYAQPGPPPRAQTMPQQQNVARPSGGYTGPVSQDELARLRQISNSNPNDHATALKLAERLVEASDTLVPDKGQLDQKGREKVRRRYLEEALRILKRLVGYQYTEAMFFLADCHGRGLFSPGPDPKEAFSLYQQAAKLNNPQAAYRLAVCCEMGQDEGGGTRRDPLKAMQWYRRAATLGDTPAMYKMGIILLKGLLGQPRNVPEALQWLQQAADRADEENPHAVHEMALLYQTGYTADGIPRDENVARDLFQRAAGLGYKFAQYQLGVAYEYGTLGFPIDPRQSIAWYSKAAAQEEHQSELALSGWYLTGSEGVIQQSDTEAYLWARKAAQAGLSKAEYAMGYFNEVGIGAPADLEAAKRWYWRAASQNYPKARERLEDLRRGGARMQKSQVTRNEVRNQKGECAIM